MYVLSYQGPNFKDVRAVVVEDEAQADKVIAGLPDSSYCGLRITSAGADSPSLKKITGPTIVILHNALTYPSVKGFHDLVTARAALVRVVKAAAVAVTAEMMKSVPEPRQSESAVEESTNEQPADNPQAEQQMDSAEDQQRPQQEPDMAKAKKSKTKTKAAKKAAKTPKAPKEKKVKDGLPRAGSKKAELLRLLQRKTGATMAEMLEATGWKACLGTAKAVAEAAKLKFRHERGVDGKPSRWYAE